jgi:hypothetical protein
MAAPVNLNKVRKARARSAARRKADANAAFHGLTRAQKDAARAEAERAAARLDWGARARPDEE